MEIVTAGTATEGCFLEEKANNFIVGLCRGSGCIGLAICDLSTGQFEVEEADEDTCGHEMARIDPSEILVPDNERDFFAKTYGDTYRKVVISPFDAWKFSFDTAAAALKNHFQTASLDGWGLEARTRRGRRRRRPLQYLKEQKKNDLRHIYGGYAALSFRLCRA